MPSKILQVPYESQNDNGATGYRECFSSSCAMLARYWGKVKNDAEYIKRRERFGDTTSAEAQLRALRSYGLTANFYTDGRPARLQAEIDAGRPVAVGWLHHGPSSAPRGGGHWSIIAGYDDTGWIMNDPNGEADLPNGGYTYNYNGRGLHYSFRNWNPRWMPSGEGGWYLACRA